MNISGTDNYEFGDNFASPAKEFQTQVLTGYEYGATVSGENTEGTIAETSGRMMQPRITPSMLQYIAWLPQARRLKILEIRRRLARGTYDLNKRLDAVLECLLADINT